MKWNEFYKLPLMIDEGGGNVCAQPGDMGYRMAFDFLSNTWMSEYPIGNEKGSELARDIVAILNGEKYNDLFFHDWTVNKDDYAVIDMNDEPCIMIRGYGELTGIGGLNLNIEEATKIQEDFRDYIIKTLNKA